jgi:hypothetical protein
VTLLDKNCPGWHIYHVQARKQVEVKGTGHFAILVSTHKGKHQWPHIDSIKAGDESYFCAMPLFDGQMGTYHLKPLPRASYTNSLSKMRAGRADKTKGYWETFIGKCFDFRLDNFASKPTKANVGELRLMNHLHFGSGAGQDRLTRSDLFFTVDAPKSYKGDTTVRIGQNQAGKNVPNSRSM